MVTRKGHDYFGTLEAVLTYHLHQDLSLLKSTLLDSHFYPDAFHSYLQPLDHWEVNTDPTSTALLHFKVLLTLLGRQRTFKPDIILHNRRNGLLIPVEIETTCSWQTVAQTLVYTGLSSYTALQNLPKTQLTAEMSAAVSTFVVFLRSPPEIARTLHFHHIRLVTLLQATEEYGYYLAFPETTPIGLLQQLVQHEELQLLQYVATTSDLTPLNKIFILQNLLVHGSEKMSHSIKELEHKGLLDLKNLEKEATEELPPEYMRYFTPEQLRGLTPEQLRGLTPEQLRGLTPEQLRGLTPEQLRGLTPEQLRGLTPEQLASLFAELAEKDPETLKIILRQVPKKARQQLLQILTEVEESDVN